MPEAPTSSGGRPVIRARWLLAGLLLWTVACGGDAPLPLAPVSLGTPTATPSPTPPPSLDIRDVTEALFLGSGTLIPGDGVPYCVARGWAAFAEGTAVRIVVSSTVPPAAVQAIRTAADQVAAATGGRVSAGVEPTGELDPRPAGGEVTVTTHPDPQSQGCAFSRGCTIAQVRSGVLLSARIVLGPEMVGATAAYVHDAVGHGILGACHIDGPSIGGAHQSLMSGGPGVFSCAAPSDRCIALTLTPLDQQAARAVYAAGLTRGADRAAFAAAGLVRPEVVGAATAARPRVTSHGDREIVILDE
jgi:hypothetical protein